jgi:hypothetical protein
MEWREMCLEGEGIVEEQTSRFKGVFELLSCYAVEVDGCGQRLNSSGQSRGSVVRRRLGALSGLPIWSDGVGEVF